MESARKNVSVDPGDCCPFCKDHVFQNGGVYLASSKCFHPHCIKCLADTRLRVCCYCAQPVTMMELVTVKFNVGVGDGAVPEEAPKPHQVIKTGTNGYTSFHVLVPRAVKLHCCNKAVVNNSLVRMSSSTCGHLVCQDCVARPDGRGTYCSCDGAPSVWLIARVIDHPGQV